MTRHPFQPTGQICLRPRQMLDLVGGTVSYRQNAPSLNSSANASVLFAAQFAGQKAH